MLNWLSQENLLFFEGFLVKCIISSFEINHISSSEFCRQNLSCKFHESLGEIRILTIREAMRHKIY